MKKVGLALGAGGARGLGHIIILEAFEELGIKPHIISGTSIGAIIGAVYAAGIPANEIKSAVDEIIFRKNSKFWEIHKKSDVLKMFSFIDPQIKSGGIIRGEKLINFLGKKIRIDKFEDLDIPLKVATTNYHTNEQVVFDKGKLLPAIRASYSLPGLFKPVEHKNMLLIDGGVVNPLPYDLIKNDCDITIAIDVSAIKVKNGVKIPPAYETLFSAFQMMQKSIISEKLKKSKPDIYLRIDIEDVRIHEFNKVNDIYKQSEISKKKLMRKLKRLLNTN